MSRMSSISRASVRGRVRGAFTLIELLLVLVILGVLAAVVVPKFTGRTEKAKISGATTSVSNLGAALNIFEHDTGHFPSNDEGLNALVSQPASAKDWNGPYIEATALKDPWGNKFIYKFPGTHNPSGFDLYSTGPDGQDGTADDIGNWTTQ